MAEALATRDGNGPLRWVGAAILISIGFLMLHGIGIVLVGSGVIWAGQLGIRRTPGFQWAVGMLVLVAVALLAAWAIF